MAAKADESEMSECKESGTEVDETVRLRDEWVAFDEESEVPCLPQPTNNEFDISSEKHIHKLERKLGKIKDTSNVTSKDIVSALTEAREGQMSNMMKGTLVIVSDHRCNGEKVSVDMETREGVDYWLGEDISESKCCCVTCYSRLFPQQAKTTQEVECLLDEDELSIIASSSDLQLVS